MSAPTAEDVTGRITAVVASHVFGYTTEDEWFLVDGQRIYDPHKEGAA